jgi:hypothetical protein
METLEKNESLAGTTEKDTDRPEHRKYERRTLKDRRNPWKKNNYKGPERRYHTRRSGKDRRKINRTADDLAHYIP